MTRREWRGRKTARGWSARMAMRPEITRFGPHGVRTHHYAPVCLNSLLYKTEKDLEQMSEMLGRKSDAKDWAKKAEERKERIQKYLWDSENGLYFDDDVDDGT